MSMYNSCLKLLLIAKAYIELLGLRQIQLISKKLGDKKIELRENRSPYKTFVFLDVYIICKP